MLCQHCTRYELISYVCSSLHHGASLLACSHLRDAFSALRLLRLRLCLRHLGMVQAPRYHRCRVGLGPTKLTTLSLRSLLCRPLGPLSRGRSRSRDAWPSLPLCLGITSSRYQYGKHSGKRDEVDRWVSTFILVFVVTHIHHQDVLPILLAPSPALALHAAHAISVLRSPSNPHFQSPGHAQLRALSYAVRWVVGIDRRDFMGSILEGERWLVQAAGGVRPFFCSCS